MLAAAAFLEEQGGADEARDRTVLERIRLSGRRMSSLINDLLDFTMTRLGRGIPITRGEVDLREIVRDTIEEVRGGRPERELRVEMAGDLRGYWDGRRLRQAVGNLVDNAVHHGEEHTPIAVAVRGRPEDVVVTVHNAGEAIPAGAVRHLFQPFRQLPGGGRPQARHQGVGLGLYIAEQIVAGHGGRIDVRSSTEQGTTFTVRLPRVS